MKGVAPHGGHAADVTECDACAGQDIFAQQSRENMLGRLVAGDVLHARASDPEASLLCVVTSIGDTTIHARRLLAPATYVFDRRTGRSLADPCVAIDSIEPLPVGIHDQIMWLDRKNRLCWDLTKAQLSAEEKHALLFVSDHYEGNQLLPPQGSDLLSSGEVGKAP